MSNIDLRKKRLYELRLWIDGNKEEILSMKYDDIVLLLCNKYGITMRLAKEYLTNLGINKRQKYDNNNTV